MEKYKFEIDETNTPLSKLTSEISKQENELKLLETEYKNVVLEQGKNYSEAKISWCSGGVHHAPSG